MADLPIERSSSARQRREKRERVRESEREQERGSRQNVCIMKSCKSVPRKLLQDQDSWQEREEEVDLRQVFMDTHTHTHR